MKRRYFLHALATATASSCLPMMATKMAHAAGAMRYRRLRPGDAAWPTAADWAAFGGALQGRLIKVETPLAACAAGGDQSACKDVLGKLSNPYYLRDEPGLTQALGWAGAWVSEPSAYAVACESAQDVAAAVSFARRHRLRVVVKGGGHSYQGTSSSRDSLLIWTRKMDTVVMHDAFVGAGCAGTAPLPAVSVGAGAIWMHVYEAVTPGARRYVQGGGCATVGVAGLIQSGGFGSYSKQYGLAAASLIEAEVVSADGQLLIANACSHPELFWALKGGGGGSLGVVTRLTLRTHALPNYFGAAHAEIRAGSDQAYRRLIGGLIAFYAEHLFNPNWGEQLVFTMDNRVKISMSFQGLDQQQAKAVWQPFFDWLAASPSDFDLTEPPVIVALPARMMWDAGVLRKFPGVVLADQRPGAPAENIFWSANEREAGKFLHAYESAWVPASLLQKDQQDRLADALYASTRRWEMALHCNKGLAGAPEEARKAAADTAMNPAVVDAFALAICAAEESRAHPLLAGRQPDLAAARHDAQAVGAAMAALKSVIPLPGAYVSESNFFEPDWQRAYWGANYPRLLAAKRKYDADGLFFVHHGVGSEAWSEDGFTRLD